MDAADKRTGRRGNRRGSGPSTGETTRDGWGCRDARIPPRDWKQFFRCQSGRNKWLGHIVMNSQTLMLFRSSCLSGGCGGDLTRWLVGSLTERRSKLTARDTSNPPSKGKAQTWANIKYNGCLHNQEHFLAMAVRGSFIIFPKSKKTILKTAFTWAHASPENWKQDEKSPWRHQMTALHWKLSENDFVATVTVPVSYQCWLNMRSVLSSGL